MTDLNISYCDEEILHSRSIGFHAKEICVKNVHTETEKFKEMELLDLSVFWNYGSLPEYLMKPVNVKIQIDKDKSPHPLVGSEPRFKVNMNIGDVVFQLSDKQHHVLYSIFERLDWFYKRQRFKKNRPVFQISEAADESEKKRICRSWWRWLIQHHYEPIKKYHSRNTPAFLSNRCRDICTYANITRSLLKKEPLSDELIEAKARIERDWEYEECKLVIYATIDREFKPTTDDSKFKEGWGSWMMRGGGRACIPEHGQK